MAQTAQAQIQDMIERASRLGDDVLASEIRAFAASRQFGLVFEHNRPERMRLYGKAVSAGDVVQVLPERGKKEGAASKLLWRVDAICGSTASLTAYRTNSYNENDEEPRQANVDDLVAVAEYDQPIYAGLRETGRVERGGDKPYQVVINGENYHALESLLFCYAGKVDCIYIDPPYNSGAKDWKYNNDYVDGSDEYRHSKWLAMMERRLKLAKKLLNPASSVLIVAIDEKEYLRLGLLLEQLFPSCGSEMITTVISAKGVARAGQFSRVEEYLFFVRIGEAEIGLGADNMLDNTRNSKEKLGKDVDWLGMRRREPSAVRGARKDQFYPVFVDSETGFIKSIGDSIADNVERNSVPCPEGCDAVWPLRKNGTEGIWGITPSTARRDLSKGYIRSSVTQRKGMRNITIKYLPEGTVNAIESGSIRIVGRNEDGSVICSYRVEKGVIPKRVWNKKSHNAETHGSLLIGALLPERKFSYPKSLYAVEDALSFVIRNNPNALVLDFFSGSGTTAHAVMRLNHQDGGHRYCVCVTNNEVSEVEEKELTKQGYRHGDPEWEHFGICEYITKPRIRAAITGRTPDGDPIKGDYKFTDEFPMADGFEENAVFFDLTYQNPDAVELGAAFEEVAPLLWLRAGARGRMIGHEERGFAVADTYAVLFDYSCVREFVGSVRSKPALSCVFIVTDDAGRFASVKAELGGLECVRLYESYLRSFKIAAEDAVR